MLHFPLQLFRYFQYQKISREKKTKELTNHPRPEASEAKLDPILEGLARLVFPGRA